PPPQRLVPKLRARVAELNSTLEDIKTTIENRRYFVDLCTNKGKYCRTCTPSNGMAGTCGQTCTLLRPDDRRGVPKYVNSEWLLEVTETKQIYECIVSEMTEAGETASHDQVEKWEKEADRPKEGTLNESERREERGWP
ncbi:hypothetical protein EK21DRAFT_16804, partial [Setomelanomma holmii]